MRSQIFEVDQTSPYPLLETTGPSMPPLGIEVPKKQQKLSQKIAPAFSPLPKARIVFRAEREPKYGRIWVNFSRGVKNGGCLFPKMVLFEGPRPSESVKWLSNSFLRPSKSSKSVAFSGTQTLLREEIDQGWGGQSAPQRTSFHGSKKLRLVDFGKK